MDNKRRITFLVDDETLEPALEINFDDIKKGDIFVLYEDDETIVVDSKNNSIFYALEDAHEGVVDCSSYLDVLEEDFANYLKKIEKENDFVEVDEKWLNS